MEELLCESNNDGSVQDSKVLNKNSTYDTFYQGIPNEKNNGLTQDEIDELIKDEEFVEDDIIEDDDLNFDDLSHMKELPKPKKNDSKFDLSYLNDIPGPDEFQQMKKQKQEEENVTKTKGLRLLSLGAIMPNAPQ